MIEIIIQTVSFTSVLDEVDASKMFQARRNGAELKEHCYDSGLYFTISYEH